MDHSYDVALWLFWPTNDFPIVDEMVTAASPLLAVLSLMDRCKLKRVARAAVGLPNHSIKRWETGLSLVYDDIPAEYRGEELEVMP
jgi:hypothetical protein